LKQAIILDSSAILNDFGFSFKKGKAYFMTSLAFEELRDMRSKLLAENAFKNGSLSIVDPCPESLSRAWDFALAAGMDRLSDADISTIALASEFKAKGKNPKVVSDDFTLQNACALLKIGFQGVLQGRIKKPRRFKCKAKKPLN
jgi:UPF0271 protein